MNWKVIECGFDESGRGAVLGPMILTIVFKEKGIFLNEFSNIKESKKLSLKKIFKVKKKLENYKKIKYLQTVINAEIITKKQNKGYSLNKIEEEILLEQIAVLSKNYQIYSLKIDEIRGLNKKNFEKYVKKIQNESKMDQKEQLSSFASIFSKAKREELISKENFGSGYPSDPKTINFLKDNKKNILDKKLIQVRYNWKTIRNL